MTLEQIFSRTFALIPELEAHQIRISFLQSWSMEQLHFFPMWMKQEKKPLAWVQVADYEYLKYQILEEPVTLISKPAWHWHSSSRMFLFTVGATALGKSEGVYLLWKGNTEVSERILNQKEVQVLEALQEDLIFDPLSAPELIEALRELEKLGIVQAPSQSLSKTEASKI